MKLQTRLAHIHSEAEFNQVVEENENVMICWGRMELPFTEVKMILKSHY